MTPTEIKALVRIQVLENHLIWLVRLVLEKDGMSPEQFRVIGSDIARQEAETTYPELRDPALSDLVAGEMEDAAKQLWERILDSGE